MYPYYPPPYPYYGPHHMRPVYPPPYIEDDGEYDEQMVGYPMPSAGHYVAGSQATPSNAIIRVGSARGQRSHPSRHFGPRTMQSQTLDQTIVSNILDRLESIESKLPTQKDIVDPSSEHAMAQIKLREDRLKEAEAELAKRSVQLDEKASALQKLSHELAKQASMIDTLTKTGAASNGPDNDPALRAEMEKIIKSQEGVIKEWQTIWGVINDVFFKFYNICAMTLPGIPEHNFNAGDPMAIVVAMQHLITGFAASVLPKEEINALNAQREEDAGALTQEVNQGADDDDDDPDNLD